MIQLHERLEEAEGGAEGQFEQNRKRDVELTKLRKLLEDVHLESEETAHLLKKKHSEIVADFQEQLDGLTKAKSRWAWHETTRHGMNEKRTGGCDEFVVDLG